MTQNKSPKKPIITERSTIILKRNKIISGSAAIFGQIVAIIPVPFIHSDWLLFQKNDNNTICS